MSLELPKNKVQLEAALAHVQSNIKRLETERTGLIKRNKEIERQLDEMGQPIELQMPRPSDVMGYRNLTDDQRQAMWDEVMAVEGKVMEFTVDRAWIEEGKTFSADAMEVMFANMHHWVGSRLLRHWQATDTPAIHMKVTVIVELS